METTTPEKKFTAGAISASVWLNQAVNKEGQNVEFRTVRFDRRFKDNEGNWKSTNNLRVNDIPKAILVLNKAYEYLMLKKSETGDNNEENI